MFLCYCNVVYLGFVGACKKSSSEVWSGGAGNSYASSESGGGEVWECGGERGEGGDKSLVGE